MHGIFYIKNGHVHSLLVESIQNHHDIDLSSPEVPCLDACKHRGEHRKCTLLVLFLRLSL